MSWHVVTLTVAEVAGGKITLCREEFERLFLAAHGPRQMALFQRQREDGSVELFLTPECSQHAAELLERWQASPCERPSLVGLHLLVGHSEITYYMP